MSKAKRVTASDLSAIGTFVGDILRDGGGVGFCAECRKAELPGEELCRACGAVLRPPKPVTLRVGDQ